MVNTTEKAAKRKVQVTLSDEIYSVIAEKARMSGASVSGVVGLMLLNAVKQERDLDTIGKFMAEVEKQKMLETE